MQTNQRVISNKVVGYELFKSSLDRILTVPSDERFIKDSWFNDEAIHAYVCLLNKRVADEQSYQLYMLSGDHSNYILKTNDSDNKTVLNFLKKHHVNLLDYKFIGLPVNIN